MENLQDNEHLQDWLSGVCYDPNVSLFSEAQPSSDSNEPFLRTNTSLSVQANERESIYSVAMTGGISMSRVLGNGNTKYIDISSSSRARRGRRSRRHNALNGGNPLLSAIGTTGGIFPTAIMPPAVDVLSVGSNGSSASDSSMSNNSNVANGSVPVMVPRPEGRMGKARGRRAPTINFANPAASLEFGGMVSNPALVSSLGGDYSLGATALAMLGDRSFVCQQCSSLFRREEHLKRHLRMHNNQRPFECEVCGQTFTRIDNQKHHMRRIHGTVIPSGSRRVQGQGELSVANVASAMVTKEQLSL